MNKKQCNIVLDLLPGYIENDVTVESKEFIEEHIKECKNCQETLKNMKNTELEEKAKIKDNSQNEIEKIKKVKKSFKTRKIILTISCAVAVLICMLFLGRTIYDKFNVTLCDKMKAVYEENRKLSNYHLKQEYKYIVYNEKGSFSYTEDAYYKDGYFKAYEYNEFKDTNKENTRITYGKMGEKTVTSLDLEDKVVIKNWIYNSFSGKENLFESMGYSGNLYSFYGLNYEDMEIKTFEGREWYFYKKGTEDKYTEYWVDKENLTDFRYVEVDPKYYRETIYTLEKNTVKDEDIKVDYDTAEFVIKEF